MLTALMRSIKNIAVFGAVMMGAAAVHLSASESNRHHRIESGYTANAGQVVDQRGELNAGVLFLFQGRGINTQLRATGYSYDLYRATQTSTSPVPRLPEAVSPQRTHYAVHRIDVSFVGMNPNLQITPAKPLAGQRHFTSASGEVSARTYQTVWYRDVYPGIDIEFTSMEGGQMEYNIVVHPGGDLSQVQLQYGGTDKIKIVDGAIVVSTSLGDLVERIPLSFIAESCRPIPVEPVVHGTTVGFTTTESIARHTLVIDPVPMPDWITYFGGTDIEDVYDIVVDPGYGDVVYGKTSSFSNVATSGAHQTQMQDTLDTFLALFSPDGQLQWATYYGAEGDEEPGGVDVDADGNIYISGTTYSWELFGTTGAHSESLNGAADGFVAKFDPSGMRLWGTYFGGQSDDRFFDVHVSPTGRLLAAGVSFSSGLATNGSYRMMESGGDGIVVEFDPADGSLVACTYVGAELFDEVRQIEMNNQGEMFFVGLTQSDQLATMGAHQETRGGNWDLFVGRLNGFGQLAWITYFGGTNNDLLVWGGFDLGADGLIYLAGFSESDSGLTTPGTFQPVYAGNGDGLVAQFTPDGTLGWATYIGDVSFDGANSVHVLPNGDILIGGGTVENSYTWSEGGWATGKLGGWDGYLARMDAAGALLWFSYIGGSGHDQVRAVYAVSSDTFALAGETWSDGIDINAAHQPMRRGMSDAMVMRFQECVVPDPAIVGDSVTCSGSTLPYSVAVYDPQNTYEWVPPDSLGVFLTRTDSAGVIVEWQRTGTDQVRVLERAPQGCQTIVTLVVRIADTTRPEIAFVSGGPVACEGDTVILTLTEQYDEVAWSTGETADTIRVTSSGDVFATVTDTLTTCSSQSPLVSLMFYPNPTPVIVGLSEICLNGAASQNYASSVVDPDVSVEWSGIDLGIPITPTDGKDITIEWTTKGSDTIYVRAVNSAKCMREDTLIVVVDDAITPVITTSTSETTLCEGDTLILDAGAGFDSYLWSTGDTTRYIDVTTSSRLTVAVTSGSCTGESDTISISTVARPVVAIQGGSVICLADPNGTYSISADTTNTIQWLPLTRGTITTAADVPTISVAWSSVGTDSVRVVITTPEGCQSTDVLTVEIRDSLEAVIGGFAGQDLCDGDSLTLLANSGVDQWTWLRDGSIVGTSMSIVVREAGAYRVVVKQASCSDTSAAVMVSVVKPPSIMIVQQGTELVAVGDTADTYQWKDGSGQDIPGATSNTYVPRADGLYTVVVTRGPCTVESAPIFYATVTQTDLFFVSDVDFGSLPVDDLINGNGGHVNEFFVVNVSSQNLSLDSARVDGDGFVIPNQFPRLMRPGDTSRITVRFIPTEYREYRSQLYVYFGSETGVAEATGVGRPLRADERITEVVLQPEQIEVAPGEIFVVTIAIGNERPTATTATEYEATVQWDSRVLQLQSTPEVFFRTSGREDNYFTAKIPEGVRSIGQTNLVQIPFRAKLADVDSTVLIFSGATAFRWKDDTKAYPACRDSVVKITICHDGGDRLITRRSTVTISGVAPNPAGDVATVIFSVTEPIDVIMEIVDPLGSVIGRHNVTVPTSGVTSTTIDVQGLPSGTYLIRMIDGLKGDSTIFIKQ